MERAELAFFPAPVFSHMYPMVELAKLLTSRDERISVTVFVMNLDHIPSHSITNSYIHTLLCTDPPTRVRFIHLSLDEPTAEHLRSLPRGQIMLELGRIHKPRVTEFLSSELSCPLGGFMVDFFCTQFIDVATELGVPSYGFFPTGFGTLNLLFYLQYLHDFEHCDITELKDSDTELHVPGFLNPVPAKVFPYSIFKKESSEPMGFMAITRKLREVQGILVNTCEELEPYSTKCLSDDDNIPTIYTVGPVLKLNPENIGNKVDEYTDIMMWLDAQPKTSVLFLCFGSMGTFEAEQVLEIARALEKSGQRFLWSLRGEYGNLNDVLQEGFLDRTKELGKVIGWAPQVAVLAHPAVGGFISHCGFLSILESLWYGVPIATWPLFAEHQLNAFELVKEWGLAVEIKLDYRKDNSEMVTADEIEKGIRQLMEDSESLGIRKKVKEVRQKIRLALVDDGSSNTSIRRFIQKVLGGGYP